MDQVSRTARQLGTLIRRFRKNRGFTQAALGERISKRQATISNLESAQAGTTLETLFAVLAALDLELVIRPRTQSSATELEDMF